ncbi:hypothetical protein ACHAPC_006172 [Botrytis cinerea]
MSIVMIWWFVSAHKWFKGPVINVEHHMMGRDPEEIMEGVEDSSDDGKIKPNPFEKKTELGGDRALGNSAVTQ